DQVVDGLAQYAKALKVGDPLERDTVVGPVISAVHRDRIEGYVESGRSDGGTVVVGGERPDLERGYYVAPTLIADCRIDMKVVQEEVFGPVVVVVPFDDDDDVVELANSTSYGLYDYVFSRDTVKAMEI